MEGAEIHSKDGKVSGNTQKSGCGRRRQLERNMQSKKKCNIPFF